MHILWTLKQEVLYSFGLIATGWTLIAVYFLEVMQIPMEWGVLRPELKDEAGHSL
jgi:hypothetical protein